jgi:hypothetical protein
LNRENGVDANILKKIEGGAEYNPFNAVFVSFSQGLPYGLLFWRFSSDTDPRTSAVWIFLNFTEFDAFGGDVVPSIRKIKHTPESGIRVWFRYLEKREICRIRGR